MYVLRVLKLLLKVVPEVPWFNSIEGKYSKFVFGMERSLFFIVDVLFVSASMTGVLRISIS